MEITDAIADNLVSFKEVGDPPSVLKSESIDIVVYRAEPADLGGKSITEGNSGVQLPSTDDLFGKNGSFPYVDFQVTINASCTGMPFVPLSSHFVYHLLVSRKTNDKRYTYAIYTNQNV
jgi:hypothetical protein